MVGGQAGNQLSRTEDNFQEPILSFQMGLEIELKLSGLFCKYF